MAAPQITGFHSLSFAQFDPLLPAPPTAIAVPASQSDPLEQDPYKDRSEPFSHHHKKHSLTQDGDLDQPLDLSFSRDTPSDGKRPAEGNCEVRCVKRGRLDNNWNGISDTASTFPPPDVENGHGGGGGLLTVHSHRYGTQDYSTLPQYNTGSGHNDPPVQAEAHSGSLLTPLRPFPTSSSVHDSGLSPYYHPLQDRRIHSPYGSESAVSSSSLLVTTSDMRHAETSRGASLGLPLPHNSVFTRSVSPLFQQSWHHSPVSVSSHANGSSLLHAPGSVSPRVQQNMFHSPIPVSSSDVQQRSLHHYDPPRLLPPLHSQNDSPQKLSSASSRLQQDMFPSPPSHLLPASQQSVLPTAQQDLLPTPQRNIISTPQQQNNLQSSQQSMLSSAQQNTPAAPQSNMILSSQQHGVFCSPHQSTMLPPSQLSAAPALSQNLTRSNDSSPRPFYRPFEDTTSSMVSLTATATYSQAEKISTKTNSQGCGGVEASPSSLSLPTSTTATPRSASADQTSRESLRTEHCFEQQQSASTGQKVAVPTQSDAESRQTGILHLSSQNGSISPAPSHASIANAAKPSCSSSSSSSSSSASSSSSTTPERTVEGESSSSSSAPYQRVKAKAASSLKQGSGPIQDNAIRSSSNVSLEPALSKPNKGRGRNLESRLMKVVGTTPLARRREERLKQQAKAKEERMKLLMSHRQQYLGQGRGDHSATVGSDGAKGKNAGTDSDSWRKDRKQTDDGNNNNNNGGCPEPNRDSSHSRSGKGKGRQPVSDGHTSDGGSHPASSEQPSPSSSSSSSATDADNNNDVGDGAPIPPDPNLKMSALDYLISKVLVERIDVPFKPENTEIKAIYTGAKQGRLTLVDLIELQVEASLKA